MYWSLHGQEAVAALKPQSAHHISASAFSSPRPRGRGRIEALAARQSLPPSWWSPRPRGRGRIEAGPYGLVLPRSLRLHGQEAVAALKRRRTAAERISDRLVSTAKRPWPH